MEKILILFIPEEKWNKIKTDEVYSRVIYLPQIENFINENPLLWEDYFKSFSSIKLNNQPLLNFFQLDEKLNVWFYNKFRIFYDNRKAFYEIIYLKRFIDKNDQITVVSENLDESIFKSKNIRVINTKQPVKHRRKITTVIKYAFIFAVRILISSKRRRSKKAHLQLYQLANEREIVSIRNSNETKKLNGVFVYLDELYSDEFGFIEDIPFPSLYKEFRVNYRMLYTKYSNTYTNEYIIFRSLIDKAINIKVKQAFSILKSNLAKIESEIQEPEELLIILHLKRLLAISQLYIRKYYAYELFFKKVENIKSVLAYSENLSQSKIVLDAAKINQIKTYGLQHGIIRAYNVGYSISKLEATIQPMPDMTLVWGDYWKQQLIDNGNYKPDSIVVVGQPRADVIPIIKKKYERNPKLITFFSQLQPDIDEKYLSAKSFVNVAKRHPTLEFAIKIHPAESDDIYSLLIDEIGAKNIYIDNQKDTFQLLSESGIIMTCFSTVGGEALCFNTPLITFDSQGRDIAGYIEDKVSYWVKSEMELDSIISRYKNNTLEPIPIQNYVFNGFSKIDGNASKRIRDIIIGNEL